MAGFLTSRYFSKPKVRNSNLFSDDDPFWSDYDQLGSRYKAQLDPYLNYTYDAGLWDKVGNIFGFNTGEDRYKFELQDRARQALAGLKTDEFQNQYNSQSEQASRMRDAGLNPDLAGEATGDPASSLEQPLSPIDSSVFDTPEKILSPLFSGFSAAFSGIQSIGAFAKALSDIGVNKAEAANKVASKPGIEISNWQSAWTAAGDWVKSSDPMTYLDFSLPDNLVGTDAGIQKLLPSLIAASPTAFSFMDKDSQRYMISAINKQMANPENRKVFWDNYKEAAKAHLEKVAAEETYGSINVADDYIKSENKDLLDFRVNSLRTQYEIDSVIASYNKAKSLNDFDYESWKAKKGLPQTLAEADLQKYLSAIAESRSNKLKYTLLLATMNRLNALRMKGDRASDYLLNGILNNGSFAPLLNTSASGGVFGVKGAASWNNFISPEMQMPQNGLIQGMSPAYGNDPFGWSWQDNK